MPECEGEICEDGTTATHGMEFPDGEVLWLCAVCYDDWMDWLRKEANSEDEMDADFAIKTLRLNQ